MTTAEHPSTNASSTAATPAKPRYTRRQVALAIVALSIGGFAVGVTEFAIMGLQLEAVADLGITIPQAGMLISAYAIGVVVGAPILSILGAKRERKSYALLLLGVFVFGHVLSFFAPNYETMLLARFLSGLPHGAYFAVAALMAAEMAGPAKRSRAIAVVLGGLAISNVLGVPVVTALGQAFGWRWMFISVIVLALITMAAVARYAPRQMPPAKATMRSELKGLKNKRLWVGIMLAVVGFSGMFALYSYIAPVSTEVTGFSESSLPWIVGLFGAGMVVGNFVGGWAADKSVLGTVVIAMALVAVFMVLFASTAHIPALMLIFLFLVGVSASALGPSMQTHLIDTAPDAPQLAASLHHSAFNAANALGALVGGQVIAAEMGLRAPSYVGAGAAVLGVGVALYAIHLTRKMKTPRTAI